MILRKKGDPEKRHIFGTHPGDLGIVAMAAVIQAMNAQEPM